LGPCRWPWHEFALESGREIRGNLEAMDKGDGQMQAEDIEGYIGGMRGVSLAGEVWHITSLNQIRLA